MSLQRSVGVTTVLWLGLITALPFRLDLGGFAAGDPTPRGAGEFTSPAWRPGDPGHAEPQPLP
jgi:hypothetical protein